MACSNARDTITQAAGIAQSNFYEYPDSSHTVTSFCRTNDGTWVAWMNGIVGQDTSQDATITDRLANKATWPSNIASAYAIGVGYFPDDGSAPVIYELPIDPFYGWDGTGESNDSRCAYIFILGDKFTDGIGTRLVSWSMAPLDVQIRTDGTNVWVVALAQESVEYPFLYGPGAKDRCGNFEDGPPVDWVNGHSDPFFHDRDADHPWWLYFYAGGSESLLPGQSYWDPGPDHSFRWQPARITVWAGDIGGFTKLDTVEAKFNNRLGYGLCGGIEAAASPAEPGVLHVLWSEAGQFGPITVTTVHEASPDFIRGNSRGQRLNYSRWDTGAKILDTDLLYAEEDEPTQKILSYGGTDYNADDNWCWTGEYVLRNDHGSPTAIICPWTSSAGPSAPEYWDLSSGSAVVLQTLDASLLPTVAEAGLSAVDVAGRFMSPADASRLNPRRSIFASPLYTDPTLADTDTYLVCVGFRTNNPTWRQEGLEPTDFFGPGDAFAFYRIPCDGSAAFSFMDDVRSVGYSILQSFTFEADGETPGFSSDFVSDPDNVWMPAPLSFQSGTIYGAPVLHFTRRCIPTWELLPGLPIPDPALGYESGQWGGFASNVSPPSIVTDASGDWLAGGGYGPNLTILSTDPTFITALRAKICRCCVPCEARGVLLWKTV